MLATIARRIVEFIKRDDGPTAVEYAVMLALIILACIASVNALTSSTEQSFRRSGSTIEHYTAS
ncbi:MAG: Flp family type IVb pilin [Fimbriiglobus sp.]